MSLFSWRLKGAAEKCTGKGFSLFLGEPSDLCQGVLPEKMLSLGYYMGSPHPAE